MTVIGPTGGGKTTLARRVVAERRYLVVIKTKLDAPQDPKIPVDRVSASWKSLQSERVDRLELRPRFKDQQLELHRAYLEIFKQGGWTCYNDEEWYVEERLRLTPDVEMLLTQGRAKYITMVMGAQRPSRISRFVLSQSAHVLAFGCEGRDLKVLADATAPLVGYAAEQLDVKAHEFLWWRRADRRMWIGRLTSGEPDAQFEENVELEEEL